MTLSVIVPVRQGGAVLDRCLDALRTSTLAPLEVIVVDDGSTDGAEMSAGRLRASVLKLPCGANGPAAARNFGASRARGDVLVFVDADVAVHPQALEGFVRVLREEPGAAAVFGSYDDNPAHPALLSRYRNLLHHFVHQHGRREASTFWAGLGAIRRNVFQTIGGFDEAYRRSSIEDIELGGRLKAAGYRILLCPDIQGTHLKRWTFAGIIVSDVRDRAIPWSRLILRQGRIPADLNTSLQNRMSALTAWLAFGAMVTAPAVPSSLWLAAGSAAALFGLNARLYAFFWRKGGLALAAAGAGMHALYLLYSSAVFGGLYVGKARGIPRLADVIRRTTRPGPA